MTALLATHAVALPAQPKDWIQLLPLGTVTGLDGRGPYRVGDKASAHAVVDASKSYGQGLPLAIDYDHATDLAASKGQPAPAAGWVRELEVRDDGIWGRVEWTGTGAARLQDGEYRYISPTFHHGKDGTVLRLVRGALTNNPNFDLAAVLAAAQGASAPAPPGGTMDLTKLLEALGLVAGTSAETALAHARELAAAKTALAAAAAGHATCPKCGHSFATPAAATAAAAPDPTQWVPMALYTATAARVQAAQATEVDAAIAAGKVPPALRDWAVGLHASNPAAFKAFVAAAPVIVTARASAGAGTNPPPGVATDALTNAEKAMAAALNLSEEAFLKAKGGAK